MEGAIFELLSLTARMVDAGARRFSDEVLTEKVLRARQIIAQAESVLLGHTVAIQVLLSEAKRRDLEATILLEVQK